jgi:N-acetylglucosaminyldiphosphoundecaprenol N-acetyl-beta-D-mannosaminyltransferase
MKKIKTNLVEFDDITMEETVNWIASSSAGCKFQYIVTPNIDHLERLINSEVNISDIYTNADLCLCDSRVLKIMLHLKKYHLKSVLPGSDLTAELFNNGHLANQKVLVFGGSDELFETLTNKYPILDLNHINPSMGFIKKENEITILIRQISEMRPNILFLAVGSPQQEIFAGLLKQHLDHGVALCIGASILFVTGEERRAPVVFQKLHIEWLFRMIMAPRLIKRYWNNFLSLNQLYLKI